MSPFQNIGVRKTTAALLILIVLVGNSVPILADNLVRSAPTLRRESYSFPRTNQRITARTPTASTYINICHLARLDILRSVCSTPESTVTIRHPPKSHYHVRVITQHARPETPGCCNPHLRCTRHQVPRNVVTGIPRKKKKRDTICIDQESSKKFQRGGASPPPKGGTPGNAVLSPGLATKPHFLLSL